MPKGVTSTKCCENCGKSVSLFAYSRHTKSCLRPKAEPVKRQAWNKGLTKESSSIVAAITEANRKRAAEGRRKKPHHSQEGLKRLSEAAKERGLGGYRPHPNRGSIYKGIWFDSNWEIRVAQILDEHQIEWQRPRIGFVWTDDGKKYYPDFFLPKYNLYLDPKNDFLIEKDKLKIREAQVRNDIKVHVLSGAQINWNYIQTLLL